MQLPVIYTHLPSDRVISNKLVDTVEVEVRTSGFKLLLYNLRGGYEPIRIDMRTVRRTRDEGYFYIATNTRLDRFSEQMGAGTRILKVIPDTIYVNFNQKVSKRVPVRTSNVQVNFRAEFQAVDSITVDPAFVTISGAKNSIDKIDHVLTEKVVLKDVNENMSKNVKVIPPLSRNQVDVSTSHVTMSLKVAKYTEGSVDLPVEVINLPPGYNIRTFPDRVTVKYQVALSDFESIKPQMFTVTADYGKMKKESGTKLKLELVKSPANIRHSKLIPDRVEFIIRK